MITDYSQISYRRIFLVFVLFILYACGINGQESIPFFENSPEEPWHLQADTVEYDSASDRYIAKGNVKITRTHRMLSADIVRFDYRRMTAVAEGNVLMTAGADVLTGNRIQVDLAAETGKIFDAVIYFHENHFIIKGDRIEKVGKETYTAHRASITTCDGNVPAWKITGKNLNIAIEGYGYVTHAAFWIKKVPVFYAPFLFFPVKTKRQTGLLPPEIGYSDRKGAEINQPFFWAINDSMDMTFYEHVMEKRGVKHGLEYRYMMTEPSKGAVMFDFLRDRKTDDDPMDTAFGYDDDAYSRPNTDRYWFRMKHDQALPYEIFAMLDVDILSDQDYLPEFKNDYTGFDETQSYFGAVFGRTLDDYNDAVRVNRLNLNRVWTNYSINAEARWYDNVIREDESAGADIRHQLPHVSIYGVRHRLERTPFFWGIDSDYNYFYREEGQKGHRWIMNPRVYWPLRYRNYFFIEPSMGFHETFWRTENDDADNAPTSENRGVFDARLDFFTEIFKNYPLEYARLGTMQHFSRLQLSYEYIENRDQTDYPYFDAADRIEKTNRIMYTWTNFFTAISTAGQDDDDSDQPRSQEAKALPAAHRFLRLEFEQYFDIDEARRNDIGENEKRRPFSPLYAEMELSPGKWFSVAANANWNVYNGDFETRETSARIWNSRGDSLQLSHLYTQDASETMNTQFRLNLFGGISMYGNYERNIFESRDISESLGFLYRAGCWSLNVKYAEEEDDRRYAFKVNFYGLGEIGGD